MIPDLFPEVLDNLLFWTCKVFLGVLYFILTSGHKIIPFGQWKAKTINADTHLVIS